MQVRFVADLKCYHSCHVNCWHKLLNNGDTLNFIVAVNAWTGINFYVDISLIIFRLNLLRRPAISNGMWHHAVSSFTEWLALLLPFPYVFEVDYTWCVVRWVSPGKFWNNRWIIKDQLDVTYYFISLPILFHFLCAQHVSDINISIIRSLRLFCWITTLVALFLVRCVVEFRCGWIGVVSVLQASTCNTDTTPTQPHRNSNTHRTKNNTTNVVIQQNSRKLMMMDILMSETYWAHKKWNKIASDIKLVFYSSTNNR